MEAEVTSIMRVMKGGDMDDLVVGGGQSRVGLVTMDLLGGYSTLDSKELDLDLQVPSGFENLLDMKSGKLYLQKCNSLAAEPKVTDEHMCSKFGVAKQSLKPLLDDGSLDLKACALERAEKESKRKRATSSPSSNSSSSIKDSEIDEEDRITRQSHLPQVVPVALCTC